MESAFAWAMAGAASTHQAATATREDTSQQRAGRTRRTSADPQRAQQGATAATTAAPAALDSLSRLQQLADASPQVAQLQRLQALANASPQVAQLRRLQALADASPQVAQLRRLQALAAARSAPVAQLAGAPEEKELVQGQFATAELQPQLKQAPRANNTGLPDQLKNGIKSLSGLSMDPVRVHYNSAQPAQLNALAYAQGSEIHVAPGQEQQLPHQAWHVVQQAQGQVRPTLQLKDGVQVNDDAGLEREADVMGSKALEGGHRAVETHRSISMPIDTAQRIEGDALNSPEAIVANNHSAPLANGQGWAQRGGNEMQRIAYQCAQAALQRQVQAWGDGSDRVEELRVWQRVEDGRGVGGKSQDPTPGFTAQRQAQERGGHLSTQLASSPRQLAQRRLIGQMLGSAVQRVEGELDEEEGGAAQLRSEPVQRVEGGLDEEEPPAAAQLLTEPAQLEENRTGMPDGLKAGIESLSGMDMSGVRVHRNSSQPAQLNALAYAQGNDIHLGPGQEQHLPHEAWHVVQQRQGRVQATMQLAGVGVNDDVGLEREADVMGGRAVGAPWTHGARETAQRGRIEAAFGPAAERQPPRGPTLAVQRKVGRADGTADLSADQVQRWLASQGQWDGLPDRALSALEKMMQSDHAWLYGGAFSYLLVRDAKALQDKHYSEGLIHGDLLAVKNEADFHVDPGHGGGLKAAMLNVARDACERMVAASTVHGAPKGRVYLRPQGAAIIKIVSQLLGEALGDPALIEQAHRAIQWRKFKEAALDKMPFYTRPKLGKEVLDRSVFPEHAAYMRSLVGVSGVDIKPLLSGTRSMEEFTQNMLEESEMGRARLQRYLDTVELGTTAVSMDIYISQDRLPEVIRAMS